MEYLQDYYLTGNFEYDDARRDMVHRFRLERAMEVELNNVSPSGTVNSSNSYRTVLMNAQMDSLEYSYSSLYELDPGDYYIYTQARMRSNPFWLEINLSGQPLVDGSSRDCPIDAGNYAAEFSFTETYDTRQTIREQSNNKAGKEGFFRFTLSTPMKVIIDNCGSEVSDTYLTLSDSDGKRIDENDYYSGEGSCENQQHACLQIPVLMPDSYYVMVDGNTDGNITLNVRGETIGKPGDQLITAIDAGTHSGGFTFSDTRNTADGYTNQYAGKPTHDVFYKLTLKNPATVTISHCGSVVTDTYLTVLGENGSTVLYSNDNYTGDGQCGSTGNAYLRILDMPAGTYYIVSEGNTQNGFITTNITAFGETGTLTTTDGQPHLITITPTVKSEQLAGLVAGEMREEVQYFDHWGNPTVKVQHGFSPYGDDLYTLTEYDGLNRESHLWLPVTQTGTNGAYVEPGVLMEAARGFAPYAADEYPYGRKVYDNSALNELREEYHPGEEWHKNGHSVKTERITNTQTAALAARIYMLDNGQLACTGNYPSGELDVMCTTDEDGNISYEFKDKANGKVLLRRQMNGEEAHDTYYVYDGNGNLCFVLPPMAADALAAAGTYTVSNDALQKYAYLYRYDGYNRCIYKKLPGADPVYTVYDAADRPVFTQDGQQRERGEWTFNISDSFNRVVLTGVCKNVLDYTRNPLDTLVVKATWANTTNALKGYTVTGVTLATPTVQQANYYDSYEFLGLNGIPNNATTAYTTAEGYGERFNGGCRGQQTGMWMLNLSSTTPIYSVNYYDDRYRMAQQKGINGNGEQTATYTHFSFTGQPLKIKRVQGANTEVLDYTYDHADRLLTTVYRLNNDPAVILTDNVYDEIGRLITDRRNGNLTKDLNKNISDIQYNCLNLPSRVTFANGDSIRYEYAVDGTRCIRVSTIVGLLRLLVKNIRLWN